MDNEKKCQPKLRLRPKIQDNWTILEIFDKAPPNGWDCVFKDAKSPYYARDEVESVSEDLDNEHEEVFRGPSEEHSYTYFPAKQNIFRAFDMTPLCKVKVVLIGQDVYYQFLPDGTPRAQGISFGIRRDDEITSSLDTMYKELENSIPGWVRPSHGDLTYWTQQGVLLLNASLTVKPGKAGTHGKIWTGVLSRVFDCLAEVKPYAPFILLGKNAQDLKKYIGDRSTIIEAPHPSGANKWEKGGRHGFLGSDVFNLANEALLKKGETPIDWSIPE